MRVCLEWELFAEGDGYHESTKDTDFHFLPFQVILRAPQVAGLFKALRPPRQMAVVRLTLHFLCDLLKVHVMVAKWFIREALQDSERMLTIVVLWVRQMRPAAGRPCAEHTHTKFVVK